MKLIKYLLTCLLVMSCISSQASFDPLDNFVNSFNEQQIVAQWVKENGPKGMTDEAALSIVKDVYVYAYSRNLSPFLILGVIRQESEFKLRARSRAGAKGLMQVLPFWHKDKLLGRDPYSQKVSIEVGTEILKECFTQFPNNKKRSFACYSGGAKDYHLKVTRYQNAIYKYVADTSKAQTLMLASVD